MTDPGATRKGTARRTEEKEWERFICNTGCLKNFTRLAGCEIKSMRPIFKTKLLIYQSKANLDEKILFGNITHL